VLSRNQFAVIAALVLIMGIGRFIGISTVPHGFYVDEAGLATNVMCLKETGAGELGDRWPIFFPAYDHDTGAFYTAPYVYPLVVWTSVFGDSIASFRLFSAFLSALTLPGLFLLGSLIGDRKTGLLCALAGALSPWLFQFARLAWDPAFIPALLTWGTYFFLRSNRWRDGLIAGLLLAAAAYDYPPCRAQLVVLLPALVWFKHVHSRIERPFALAFLATLILIGLPLVYLTITGEIQGRFREIGVFAPDFLQREYGSTNRIYGLLAFAKNVLGHFSPEYLFHRGDMNARHSTRYTGILGGLDMLALMFLLLGVLRHYGQSLKFMFFCVAGYLGAVLASSATWFWVPNALRSIGGAPFAMLITGFTLRVAIDRFRLAPAVIVGVSCLFAGSYLWIYFVKYPHTTDVWFDVPVLQSAEATLPNGDWQRFLADNRTYLASGLHYYLMAYGHQSCRQSADELRQSR
jgi:4-amino-4-deoxy-L-arabinose transferase-like glycosyltransferase